jgi:hypothetical protein
MLYPDAKVFGLTTGLAVMKINSELGYEPVTYSELTQDEAFWAGCKSCINYEILTQKQRKHCLCTAMLFDPADENVKQQEKQFLQYAPSKTKAKSAVFWHGVRHIFRKKRSSKHEPLSLSSL